MSVARPKTKNKIEIKHEEGRSRVEEIQQWLGEREDQLHREMVHQLALRLAAEREAKVKKSPK